MAYSIPHNPEAEAAVLGGVMLRNEALNEVVTIVDEDAFHVPAHRSVFRAMVKLFESGKPMDVVTLEHQLRTMDELGLVGGIEGLGKLADRYASSHNILHHAGLVQQSATLRSLVTTTREIADEGCAGGVEDVEGFVDDAEGRVLAIGRGARRKTFHSAKELIKDAFVRITERVEQKNPVTGVPTEFPRIDAMTGGLQGSDLVVLAARPSMGKTALALNIAQNACVTRARHLQLPEKDRPPRYPVLFFSLEMSKEQLIERLLCSEARVDLSLLRSGRLREEEFGALVRAADRLHEAPLFIDDSAAPTILEIRARSRRFRQDRSIFPEGTEGKTGRGLVVVDYLQLARGGGRGRYDLREQEISEISRGLKGLAKELGLPVLALSQLNRGVETRDDKRPRLADLRESGAIEQDADLIMFIYRRELYEPDDRRREFEGQAEVIIGKQRNGPTGTVNLTFLGKYTRFENPADR
jgi:replicative DNA helicase